MMKVWDNGDGIHAIQIDFGYYFIMDQNYGEVLPITIVFTKLSDNTSESYTFSLRRDSEDKLRYSVKCVNISGGTDNGSHFTSVKVSGSGRYLTIQQSTYPYGDPAQYTVTLAPFQFNAFSRATVDTSTMTAKYTEVLNANNARIDDLIYKYGEAMARCARLEKIVENMIDYNNLTVPALISRLNAASVNIDSDCMKSYLLYNPPDTANGNPNDDTNYEDATWNKAAEGFYTINPIYSS
jgi:hypothetical protein